MRFLFVSSFSFFFFLYFLLCLLLPGLFFFFCHDDIFVDSTFIDVNKICPEGGTLALDQSLTAAERYSIELYDNCSLTIAKNNGNTKLSGGQIYFVRGVSQIRGKNVKITILNWECIPTDLERSDHCVELYDSQGYPFEVASITLRKISWKQTFSTPHVPTSTQTRVLVNMGWLVGSNPQTSALEISDSTLQLVDSERRNNVLVQLFDIKDFAHVLVQGNQMEIENKNNEQGGISVLFFHNQNLANIHQFDFLSNRAKFLTNFDPGLASDWSTEVKSTLLELMATHDFQNSRFYSVTDSNFNISDNTQYSDIRVRRTIQVFCQAVVFTGTVESSRVHVSQLNFESILDVGTTVPQDSTHNPRSMLVVFEYNINSIYSFSLLDSSMTTTIKSVPAKGAFLLRGISIFGAYKNTDIWMLSNVSLLYSLPSIVGNSQPNVRSEFEAQMVKTHATSDNVTSQVYRNCRLDTFTSPHHDPASPTSAPGSDVHVEKKATFEFLKLEQVTRSGDFEISNCSMQVFGTVLSTTSSVSNNFFTITSGNKLELSVKTGSNNGDGIFLVSGIKMKIDIERTNGDVYSGILDLNGPVTVSARVFTVANVFFNGSTMQRMGSYRVISIKQFTSTRSTSEPDLTQRVKFEFVNIHLRAFVEEAPNDWNAAEARMIFFSTVIEKIYSVVFANSSLFAPQLRATGTNARAKADGLFFFRGATDIANGIVVSNVSMRVNLISLQDEISSHLFWPDYYTLKNILGRGIVITDCVFDVNATNPGKGVEVYLFLRHENSARPYGLENVNSFSITNTRVQFDFEGNKKCRGAAFFVSSKMSGLTQVIFENITLLGNYNCYQNYNFLVEITGTLGTDLKKVLVRNVTLGGGGGRGSLPSSSSLSLSPSVMSQYRDTPSTFNTQGAYLWILRGLRRLTNGNGIETVEFSNVHVSVLLKSLAVFDGGLIQYHGSVKSNSFLMHNCSVTIASLLPSSSIPQSQILPLLTGNNNLIRNRLETFPPSASQFEMERKKVMNDSNSFFAPGSNIKVKLLSANTILDCASFVASDLNLNIYVAAEKIAASIIYLRDDITPSLSSSAPNPKMQIRGSKVVGQILARKFANVTSFFVGKTVASSSSSPTPAEIEFDFSDIIHRVNIFIAPPAYTPSCLSPLYLSPNVHSSVAALRCVNCELSIRAFSSHTVIPVEVSLFKSHGLFSVSKEIKFENISSHFIHIESKSKVASFDLMILPRHFTGFKTGGVVPNSEFVCKNINFLLDSSSSSPSSSSFFSYQEEVDKIINITSAAGGTKMFSACFDQNLVVNEDPLLPSSSFASRIQIENVKVQNLLLHSSPSSSSSSTSFEEAASAVVFRASGDFLLEVNSQFLVSNVNMMDISISPSSLSSCCSSVVSIFDLSSCNTFKTSQPSSSSSTSFIFDSLSVNGVNDNGKTLLTHAKTIKLSSSMKKSSSLNVSLISFPCISPPSSTFNHQISSISITKSKLVAITAENSQILDVVLLRSLNIFSSSTLEGCKLSVSATAAESSSTNNLPTYSRASLWASLRRSSFSSGQEEEDTFAYDSSSSGCPKTVHVSKNQLDIQVFSDPGRFRMFEGIHVPLISTNAMLATQSASVTSNQIQVKNNLLPDFSSSQGETNSSSSSIFFLLPQKEQKKVSLLDLVVPSKTTTCSTSSSISQVHLFNNTISQQKRQEQQQSEKEQFKKQTDFAATILSIFKGTKTRASYSLDSNQISGFSDTTLLLLSTPNPLASASLAGTKNSSFKLSNNVLIKPDFRASDSIRMSFLDIVGVNNNDNKSTSSSSYSNREFLTSTAAQESVLQFVSSFDLGCNNFTSKSTQQEFLRAFSQALSSSSSTTGSSKLHQSCHDGIKRLPTKSISVSPLESFTESQKQTTTNTNDRKNSITGTESLSEPTFTHEATFTGDTDSASQSQLSSTNSGDHVSRSKSEKTQSLSESLTQEIEEFELDFFFNVDPAIIDGTVGLAATLAGMTTPALRVNPTMAIAEMTSCAMSRKPEKPKKKLKKPPSFGKNWFNIQICDSKAEDNSKEDPSSNCHLTEGAVVFFRGMMIGNPLFWVCIQIFLLISAFFVSRQNKISFREQIVKFRVPGAATPCFNMLAVATSAAIAITLIVDDRVTSLNVILAVISGALFLGYPLVLFIKAYLLQRAGKLKLVMLSNEEWHRKMQGEAAKGTNKVKVWLYTTWSTWTYTGGDSFFQCFGQQFAAWKSPIFGLVDYFAGVTIVFLVAASKRCNNRSCCLGTAGACFGIAMGFQIALLVYKPFMTRFHTFWNHLAHCFLSIATGIQLGIQVELHGVEGSSLSLEDLKGVQKALSKFSVAMTCIALLNVSVAMFAILMQLVKALHELFLRWKTGNRSLSYLFCSDLESDEASQKVLDEEKKQKQEKEEKEKKKKERKKNYYKQLKERSNSPGVVVGESRSPSSSSSSSPSSQFNDHRHHHHRHNHNHRENEKEQLLLPPPRAIISEKEYEDEDDEEMKSRPYFSPICNDDEQREEEQEKEVEGEKEHQEKKQEEEKEETISNKSNKKEKNNLWSVFDKVPETLQVRIDPDEEEETNDQQQQEEEEEQQEEGDNNNNNNQNDDDEEGVELHINLYDGDEEGENEEIEEVPLSNEEMKRLLDLDFKQ